MHLGREESLQFGREVDESPVVVLGGTRTKAEPLGVQIEVPALEREHFALRAPAERVGDGLPPPEDLRRGTS